MSSPVPRQDLLAALTVTKSMDIPEDDLIDDLQQVADSLGHVPEPHEYTQNGNFSIEPFVRAFGSWNRGLQAAGYEPVGPGAGWRKLSYHGPNWQEQREKALQHDGYVCQDCRMTNRKHYQEYGQSLHVHHIRRFREFDHYEEANRVENLVTLCQACHRKWEGSGKEPH